MRNPYKFAVLALTSAIFLAGSVLAQRGVGAGTFGGATIHGTPPSVTSFGFGGHPGFHGAPPSVGSLNFGRIGHGTGFGFHARPRERRRDRQLFYPYYGVGYYVPYGYDYGYGDSDYAAMPAPQDNGPDYGPPPYSYPSPRADDYRVEVNPQPQAPVSDQAENRPSCMRRSGAQEVKNYAIVGSTLFDLSDGRTHKVQLAELDLPATVKQNDDRGITFQLPAGTKLN